MILSTPQSALIWLTLSDTSALMGISSLSRCVSDHTPASVLDPHWSQGGNSGKSFLLSSGQTCNYCQLWEAGSQDKAEFPGLAASGVFDLCAVSANVFFWCHIKPPAPGFDTTLLWFDSSRDSWLSAPSVNAVWAQRAFQSDHSLYNHFKAQRQFLLCR